MVSFKEFYLLKESYFDSWELPEGCPEWRKPDKYGRINPASLGYDELELVINGCKPMTLTGTNNPKAFQQQVAEAGLYVEIVPAAGPGPEFAALVGTDPEWIRRGAEVFTKMQATGMQPGVVGTGGSDDAHIEFGKALGYGKYATDIRDIPERVARDKGYANHAEYVKAMQAKEDARGYQGYQSEFDFINQFTPTL